MKLQPEDFDQEKKPIAKGTYGQVFKGKWKSLPVAMKRHHNDEAEVSREVTLLTALRHHNIIVYYGTVTLYGEYYIVTELAENGSLWGFIHSSNPPSVDPARSLFWAKGIASGAHYLHQQDCLHRDLKSPNILLKDDLTAKICDFGCAKYTDKNPHGAPQSDIRGTYEWMSPEAIEWKTKTITKASDVYSYGIVLYELFTHEEPFCHLVNCSRHDLPSKILRGERPSSNKQTKVDLLMRQCWEEEPGRRPSFSDILSELKKGRIATKG